jgi:hypothetical protein
MANPDTPNGLSPCNSNGAPYAGQTNLYYVPSTDSVAMAVGDPVTLAGSADASGVAPTVKRLTGGAPDSGAEYIPVGIVAGFAVDPDALEVSNYRAANTARYVLVQDDPSVFFVVQEDSVGGALAITNVGERANFIMGTPSATTGLSNVELDSSTAAASANTQMQIIRLLDVPQNEIGTNAKWIGKFNRHMYAVSTAGI